MTQRTIKAWYLVHKWTSLACTLFLLMLCVTGLPLIFREEIDTWLQPPPPLAAASGVPALSADALLARALARHPGETPLYLSFDDERPISYITTAPTIDAAVAKMHFEAFDQRSGATLPTRTSGVMDFILQLHVDMFLGLKGELFLGAMGLLFAAAIVSGVVLYAPFMAKLAFGTVRRTRTARLRWLDRHNLLGVMTLVWALVVGVTGTINTLVLPITAMWKADQLAAMAAGDGTGAPVRGTASVQAALDAAARLVPDAKPQFVAFPGTPYSSHRHYGLFLKGATPLTARLLTPVFVDALSGRVAPLRPVPWYMKVMLLAQPLHFGDYGGLAMKLLWALLDLLTIVVLGSGLYLWLGRRAAPAAVRVREITAGSDVPALADL
ncbi:PepSY-associated TM helix domain-containing protein [Sphingomonas nostoxanthinifaciens]|uniref:PepSY-associated TM helix domain-containing protein n=1 Tax=Sphingomonas nostoxanthinifaciens TaxID=2872652 RepID=UPI001CC1EDA5|nr:PepSY-associated TM helix domain-containing protein [Sphingomonas nostoxanthinifaciens]UAK23245.1 PepSY domain-containing protein [Sphingomonas nostoxanthinifaciens]